LQFQTKFFVSDGERAVRVCILRPPGYDFFEAPACPFRLLCGEVQFARP
jgi:hypothetical protein